jgi:hypothetical protein
MKGENAVESEILAGLSGCFGTFKYPASMARTVLPACIAVV